MWYHVLHTVANEDITKHEQVLEMSAIEVLNHLSYLKYIEQWRRNQSNIKKY